MTSIGPVAPISPAPAGHPRRTRHLLVAAVAVVALAAFAIWAKHRIDGLSTETQATNPIFRWEYLFKRDQTPSEIWGRFLEHLGLTLVPVVLGTIISAFLSALILRLRWLRGAVFTFAGFLYTIPSLALFGVLVTYNTNWTAAIIALTSYTLLIITRNIVAGIDGVPASALDAADGLGMSRFQRLRKVELPLAMPVILAGIRVATVTTIGLVGISKVIQLGGVAGYIFDGFNRDYSTLIVLGSVLIVLIAVAFDLILRGVEWLSTPWLHRQAAR